MVKKDITTPIKKTIIPKTPIKKSITIPKIPKKSISLKKTIIPKKKPITKIELEEALLNNFINLQKVLTNLSIKFEELSDNITKLLQLFEISAKSFTERYSEKDRKQEIKQETKEDKNLLNKLDSLLNQNKTIAKGIMLMEGRIRQRNAPVQTRKEEEFRGMLRSKPLPRY